MIAGLETHCVPIAMVPVVLRFEEDIDTGIVQCFRHILQEALREQTVFGVRVAKVETSHFSLFSGLLSFKLYLSKPVSEESIGEEAELAMSKALMKVLEDNYTCNDVVEAVWTD